MVAFGTCAASWICAVVFYLKMMGTLDPQVKRLHMARYRIRGNLLFLACPDLFVGAGALSRRRYIAALLTFGASLVLGFIADTLLAR
jgi:hypothetical protein